jgi:hypothetical protein
MSIGKLSGPALRFLRDRLERLHASLEALALRLREGIAGLVGVHVRDALRAALGRPPTAPADPWAQPDHPFALAEDDPRGPGPAPLWVDEPPAPPAAAPAPQARPGWRSLLAGGLQLAGWWLRDRARRPLLRWLGVGAGVALALAAGPVTAGVLAAVAVAVALTALADSAAATAGTLAGVGSS